VVVRQFAVLLTSILASIILAGSVAYGVNYFLDRMLEGDNGKSSSVVYHKDTTEQSISVHQDPLC
jgi:hypothetical protein